MESSSTPRTREMSTRMMSLADGAPTFSNVDIIDDRAFG